MPKNILADCPTLSLFLSIVDFFQLLHFIFQHHVFRSIPVVLAVPRSQETRPHGQAVDLLVCTIICTEKHLEVGRWLSVVTCQHLQNSSRYEQTVAQIKLNSFLLIQCFAYYTNLRAFCLQHHLSYAGFPTIY